MRRIALALAGALLTTAGSGLADAPAPRAEEAPARRYYGWQNMVVEGSGLVLAARGVWVGSDLMFFTGAATYAFGGTVVHAAHGNVGAAIASPFIQVGVPLVLGGIGYVSAERRYEAGERALLGGILGALLAPALDSALGWERVVVAPTVDRGRVGLTVGGVF